MQIGEGEEDEEDIDAKRRRVLEETRDVDADSEAGESDSSEDDRYVSPGWLSGGGGATAMYLGYETEGVLGLGIHSVLCQTYWHGWWR